MTVLPAAAPIGSFQEKPVILAIFAITYLGIAVGRIPGLKLNRVGIALLGAIGMMIFAGISTSAVVASVNWPTIFLLYGFFVISAQLRLSGFYDQVAGGISARLGHPAKFMLVLILVAGGLSAVLNNDIVAFVFAPIVGSALLRQRINPVPYLIALAVATNIGAAATLIGNAQGMMIGQIAHLGFARYLAWAIAPVTVSLLTAFGIIWFMSGKSLGSTLPPQSETAYQTYPFDLAHTIKGLLILAVVVGVLFTSLPKEIIALAAAAIHLASPKFKTEDLLKLVDWPILVLFMSLFVVTGAFQSTGYGDQAAQWLAQSGVNLNSPPVLALVTAALSNIIGNSGTVMLLLKLVDLSHPVNAYTLAVANSFGGNLLLIGSVANIIVIQQARTLGIKISFGDFAKLGIPVTLAALAALLLWILLVG